MLKVSSHGQGLLDLHSWKISDVLDTLARTHVEFDRPRSKQGSRSMESRS
jgi:hypothetical protein